MAQLLIFRVHQVAICTSQKVVFPMEIFDICRCLIPRQMFEMSKNLECTIFILQQFLQNIKI